MLFHIDDAICPTNGASTRLRLEGELTNESAAKLKESLMAVMERHAAILVDCSAVARIDSAALMLLCAAHRTAAATGKSLSISGLHERAFDETVQREILQRSRPCLCVSSESEFCLLQGLH